MAQFPRWAKLLKLSGCLLMGGSAGHLSAGVIVGDDFETDVAAGRLASTAATTGLGRVVVDASAGIEVAHGSLRLPPPQISDWGQQALAYGPLVPRAGTAAVWRLRFNDVETWDPSDPTRFAIGWFDASNPPEPAVSGAALVFRRGADGRAVLGLAGPRNDVPMVHSLVPGEYQLFATLRSDSVLFHVSSLSASVGVTYPFMRPVAIVPLETSLPIFAALAQRHARDADHPTIVEAVRVVSVPEFQGWASGADYFEVIPPGPPRAPASESETEPKTPRLVDAGAATLGQLGGPVGLISAVLESTGEPTSARIDFRWRDSRNRWWAEVGESSARLVRMVDGRTTVIATERTEEKVINPRQRYWVVDDGQAIQLWRDQSPVLWAVDAALAESSRAGVSVTDGHRARFRSFEANLRSVAIPAELRVGAPFRRTGSVRVLADDFRSEAGAWLRRGASPTGLRWLRVGGPDTEGGSLERLGSEGVGTLQENAGFVQYLVPWPDAEFADVRCDLASPKGAARTSAGVALWHNESNFLLATWESFDGRLGVWCVRDGHWVSVDSGGWRTAAGATQRLRLSSDGDHFALWVNDRWMAGGRMTDYFPGALRMPVLRVGLSLTRRAGRGDQGTVFRHFEGWR